jgi:hypothetical protein
LEPAHFRADDDWHKRKGDYNPIKIWAIGQVIASQMLLNAFADPKLGRDGIFPELVLFDCHACHHPMSQKKWDNRLGTPPGRARLNDSNLLILRAIIRVIDPDKAQAFNQRVHYLHQAVSGDGDPTGLDPVTSAQNLSISMDAYVQLISRQPYGLPQLQQTFVALVDEAGQFTDYAGAEQAYMAISNLSLSLANRGALKSATAVNRQLAEMRKTLSQDEAYQPKVFARQLSELKTIVMQTR